MRADLNTIVFEYIDPSISLTNLTFSQRSLQLEQIRACNDNSHGANIITPRRSQSYPRITIMALKSRVATSVMRTMKGSCISISYYHCSHEQAAQKHPISQKNKTSFGYGTGLVTVDEQGWLGEIVPFATSCNIRCSSPIIYGHSSALKRQHETSGVW